MYYISKGEELGVWIVVLIAFIFIAIVLSGPKRKCNGATPNHVHNTEPKREEKTMSKTAAVAYVKAIAEAEATYAEALEDAKATHEAAYTVWETEREKNSD